MLVKHLDFFHGPISFLEGKKFIHSVDNGKKRFSEHLILLH